MTDSALPGLENITSALEHVGWCVLPDFLDQVAITALSAECRALDVDAQLAPAATGRGTSHARAGFRGDRTHWFEAAALTPAQARYWAQMEALRVALNRALLLGLEELEAHYALYPPGAGYARHRDRFRDDDARVLSSVLYLNDDWCDADGGALRLHLPDGAHDVAPRGGTLVLFLSADIEHEVLPATRERLSVAGWFRRPPL
jgi:SM-20-related protein